MKILLFEEYSGFFSNLKTGFRSLGHEVTFIGTGDGWKSFHDMDYKIESNAPGWLGKIQRRFSLIRLLPRLRGFDAVLIINQSALYPGISTLCLIWLKLFNKSLFLMACGADLPFAKYGKAGGYKKGMWPYEGIQDQQLEKYIGPVHSLLHKQVKVFIKSVIPITYEYAQAWRNIEPNVRLEKTIPPCIDVTKFPKKCLSAKKKLIITHGLNREAFKGTPVIKAALDRLAQEYPDRVEVVLKGRLPIDRYIQLLNESDLIVDSCRAYSYSSMNALYAMGLGKAVAISCEPECAQEYELELEKIPVIPIKNDVEDIYKKLERFVLNPKESCILGQRAQEFVRTHHEPSIIAARYVDVFRC